MSARASATISASEFKATCLELMDEIARTDTDVIVTKHGRPVVRVSAVQTRFESPSGFIRGSVVSYGDTISPDDALWDTPATELLASRPADRRESKATGTPSRRRRRPHPAEGS